MFEYLLSSCDIANMHLRNRLVTSAMETCYSNPDGTASQRYIDYMLARARGGWGMITTEMNAVSVQGKGYLNCTGMWSDEQIPGQKELVSRVHEVDGAKICLQIAHAGKQTTSKIAEGQIAAPSGFTDNACFEVPHELANAEIKSIVKLFGDAAQRAKFAGFDAVEVHGAHGYLIHEFLSPFYNKRTDEYGGSLGNRARFAAEIIREIKNRNGEDYPVIFRFSMSDFHDFGGLYVNDLMAICLILEDAGADAFNCSCGAYASKGLYPTVPYSLEHAYNTDWTEKIKKTVGKPVFANGRINDPYLAEALLRSGRADVIAMGRPSLADPELPNKIASGMADDIVPCIACNQGCVGELMKNSSPIMCLMNPAAGREGEYDFSPAGSKKKVAVIGGGPAGLGASYAAAKRGHSVDLYEKKDRLGGQWNLAAVPPGKQELGALTYQMEKRLRALGVNIHLNEELNKADAGEYDCVIVASGSQPAVPPVPGIDSPCVMTVREVLGFTGQTGRCVAVIGAGQAGCELASFLASLRKKVSLIEMKKSIASDAAPGVLQAIREELAANGVKIYTDASVKEIGEGYVLIDRNGELRIDADSVVIAAGVKSDTAALEYYRDCCPDVKAAGDALKTSNGLAAFHEGFNTGYYI